MTLTDERVRNGKYKLQPVATASALYSTYELYEKKRKCMKPIYLNQPGDYSGNTWHVAASLILNSNVEVIQTVSRPVVNADKKTLQARALYVELCFGKRIHSLYVNENFADGLNRCSPEGKFSYLEKNENEARKYLETRYRSSIIKIENIYKSTSIIMKHIEDKGIVETTRILKHAFTCGFENKYPKAALEINEIVKSIPQNSILVNGRFSDYTKSANLGKDMLNMIRKVLTAKSDIRKIIIIANKEFKNETASWGIEYEDWIDIYNFHPSLNNIWGTGCVNMIGTAYFWKELQKQKENIMVIGGRSGSLDIASFMGNKTIAWDNLGKDDPECARHVIQSPLLNSIFHYAGTGKNNVYEYYLDGTDLRKLSDMEALFSFIFENKTIRPNYISNYYKDIIMNGMESQNSPDHLYK